LAGQPDNNQMEVMIRTLNGWLQLPQGALLLVAGLTLVAACGGDPGAEAEVSDRATRGEPATEPATDAETRTGAPALQPGLLEAAEFAAEIVTADGTARVFVVIDCDPVTGGNLVTINPVGFAAGQLITAEIDPPIGGSVGAQIGPDGSGVGARQTSLDEERYTLTIELDGESLETTFPGCGTGS